MHFISSQSSLIEYLALKKNEGTFDKRIQNLLCLVHWTKLQK